MRTQRTDRGFTFAEIMVSLGVTMLLLGAIFTASVSLTRAYAAVDNYFAAHMQQIRIMDFLARDVKRSFSVTVSPDLSTVTCIMPNYTVRSTDPEGVSDSALIGTRRNPVVVGTINKAVVDYGTLGTRVVWDGKTTLLSPILNSTTGIANFTTSDIGRPITGTNIPANTTILLYNSPTQVTLSKPATGSGSNLSFSIYGSGTRTVIDAVVASGSKTITSPTAYFTAADVGLPVIGPCVAAGTTIASVTNSTTAVLSANAVTNGFKTTLTFGGTVVVYAISGKTITRRENGQLTTIASSTDALLPQTTNWLLSNTQYTTTTVTFLPIFTSGGTAAQRSGTTVHATAYLRNKRRGN